MIIKIIGVIIVLFGLALPGAKYSRKERWSDAKSFFKYSLWFLLGIAIAGFGLWVFHLGAG